MLWSNIVLPKAVGLNDASSAGANLFRGTVHFVSQIGWVSDRSWKINSVSSRRDNRSGLAKFISEAYPLAHSRTYISLGSVLGLLPPAVSERLSIHTSTGSLREFSWTCFAILDEFLLFLGKWIYTELRVSVFISRFVSFYHLSTFFLCNPNQLR